MSYEYHHYSDYEIAVMKRMWREGATAAEIAEETGRSKEAIGSYVCTRRGQFPRRHRKWYRWMIEDAAVMWDFGCTVDEIAVVVCMTKKRARALVNKAIRLGYCRQRHPRKARQTHGEAL